MMSCKQASRLLSQSQERRGSLRQRLALRLHLAFCAACRQFSRQLVFLRSAIRQLGRNIENDERLRMSQASHQRIAAAMKQHERPAVGDVQQDPNKTID